jgi:hypothetical protein
MKVVTFAIGLIIGCIAVIAYSYYFDKDHREFPPRIISPQVNPTQNYELSDFVSTHKFLKSINKSNNFIVFPISETRYGIYIISENKNEEKESDFIISKINRIMNRINVIE